MIKNDINVKNCQKIVKNVKMCGPRITQLYFQGDPHIPTDAAASITSGSFDATNRIIPLISNSNGELEGTWDIIIDGDRVNAARVTSGRNSYWVLNGNETMTLINTTTVNDIDCQILGILG